MFSADDRTSRFGRQSKRFLTKTAQLHLFNAETYSKNRITGDGAVETNGVLNAIVKQSKERKSNFSSKGFLANPMFFLDLDCEDDEDAVAVLGLVRRLASINRSK